MEARRAAAQVALGEAASGLRSVPEETGLPPSHAQEALASPGQPLDGRVRAELEPRFGHDFSRVRVHTDSRAAESAGALHGRAYTFGQDIVFGPGRYQPATSSGRHLIGHELAHVVQQGRAGRTALQLDSEVGSLPEEDRKKVQVITETLSKKRREEIERAYLAPGVPKLPSGMTVQFGASVAKSSHDGLNAVVGIILAAGMPPNTSITLAISAAGGAYRFTRVERSSTKDEVMIVERTGDLGTAFTQVPATKPVWEASPGPYSRDHGPLAHRQARQMSDCLALGAGLEDCKVAVPETTLREGEFEIRKVKMRRGPGWKVSDWTALHAALEALPETVLQQAVQVKFLRKPRRICGEAELKAKKCDSNTEADTSPAFRRITLFNIAFRESSTRQGTSTLLESTLIHEIGHLADATALVNALVDQQNGALSLQKLKDTRSLSGMAWIDNVIDEQGGIHLGFQDPVVTSKGSFREAAIKDGLVLKDGAIASGGVTHYGQTDWGELFAESYMIYFTDPDLLKAIRPNVFKYFEAIWPQKKKSP